MKEETIVLNKERNVTLTAYIQQTEGEFEFKKRPAMIVIPGGGYSICSDREADPVAAAYLRAGYQAFVLRYTVLRYGKWPDPLNDYEQAFETVVSRAEEWGIDQNKIAVVGFSAGGHLAACAATVAKNRPAAAVLVYPAILKAVCDMCQPGMPYPNEHVNQDTCPCFIAAARDDHTVDVKNSIMFELALTEKGIPFESHIYSFGGHGFSTGERWAITSSVSDRLPNWVDDSIGWLRETMGELTRQGFTEPNIAVGKNGDGSAFLSINCSVNYVLKQGEKVQKIIKPLSDRLRAIAKQRSLPMDAVLAAIGSNSIREMMEMVGMSPEDIRKADSQLRQIPNRIG